MAMAIELERKFRVLTPLSTWEGHAFNPLAAWDIRQGYLTPSRRDGEPSQDPEVRVRRVHELDVASIAGPDPTFTKDADGVETVLYWLAVKAPVPTDATGALSRHELETPIGREFFEDAWRLCERRRLRKIRIEYMVNMPVGGHRVVTVDRFGPPLQGLVMAEIEFGTWEASREFEAPGFLGLEVTHDVRYSNVSLASSDGPPEAE